MSEDLISTDVNFFSIYIHSGITSTITTSFSSPWIIGLGPQALTFDGGVPTRRSGNLINASESSESVFIHVGVTSTITTSFSMPDLADWGPIAITVDASGNLISARAEGFKTVRIHAGITNTVTTSFSTPASNCRGITVDASGNLISADAALTKIYIHAGITSTITTSFVLVPYALPNDVEITEAGNLITIDYFKTNVFIHSGITVTITTSFSCPKNFPWGVTIRHPGWTGEISGVTNPAEVMGIAVANIAAVKGVA